MQTKSIPYTFTRRGYFYFTRRIPNDLVQHYDTDRIVEGLRTKSPSVARTRSLIAAAKLDEYWQGLRVANPDLPGKHRLRDLSASFPQSAPLSQADQDKGPKLSESLQIYFKQKGHGKSKVFFNVNNRACAYVVRRQNIWRNSWRRLAESGPRLWDDVMRRACGAASADIRGSVV
ncbi:hypothetical protein LZA78_14345, partial [Sinirhodobacter sp. WL0062]|nr:hypothetical protein [Sinirhodobacter sp. WL0062]